MRKNFKVLGAVAVAGLVAATGSAFTAGGLGANPAAEFVGGNVVQSVVGTTVTSVVYDTNESTNKITSVTLTFGNELVDGKTPTLVFGGTGATAYTCAAVTVALNANTSVCSPTVSTAPAANTVDSTTITVA